MQRFHESQSTSPILYDRGTVRTVLARASEIEAQTGNDLLTAREVEALGTELGLSPDAVRRALGETTGRSTDVTVQTRTRRSSGLWEVIRSSYLPNFWVAVMGAPQSYIENHAVDTGAMSGETMIAMVLYAYIPLLFALSLRSGFVAKRPIIGILGTWVAAMLTCAISCTAGYMGGLNHPTTLDLVRTNFFFSLLGLIGGALGVGARYTWDGLRNLVSRRRYTPVRTTTPALDINR